MKATRVTPEFGGYQFSVSTIPQYNGTEVKWYGWELKGEGKHEAGGAYETIEGATRAVLARIETLAFDGKHAGLVDLWN